MNANTTFHRRCASALTHPATVAALIVLLINDLALKAIWMRTHRVARHNNLRIRLGILAASPIILIGAVACKPPDDGIAWLGITEEGTVVTDGEHVLREGQYEMVSFHIGDLKESLADDGGYTSNDGGLTWTWQL